MLLIAYMNVACLIVMLLPYYDGIYVTRGISISSFAFIWLDKGNQNEFREHPKFKWLDGELEPPTSGLLVHCSTT